MKRCLLVLNPKAGGVSLETIQTAILNAYNVHQPQDCCLEIITPESPQVLINEVAQAAHRTDVVVAAGGDGTIMEVINAVVPFHNQLALGILPVGTGNRLASNMGIPSTLKEAWDTILFGTTVDMDLGQITSHVPLSADGIQTRYFALMAGAGIDARIIEHVKPDEKKHLGVMAYVWQGVKQAFQTPYAVFDVVVDGQRYTIKGIGVTVTNAAHLLGDYLTLAPGFQTDDGLLDVCVIASSHRMDYWPTLIQFLLQQHLHEPQQPKKEGISYFRGRQIEIHSRPRLNAQADGDMFGQTPLIIEAIPKAIQVCVPHSRALGYPVIQPLLKGVESVRLLLEDFKRSVQ